MFGAVRRVTGYLFRSGGDDQVRTSSNVFYTCDIHLPCVFSKTSTVSAIRSGQ